MVKGGVMVEGLELFLRVGYVMGKVKQLLLQ